MVNFVLIEDALKEGTNIICAFLKLSDIIDVCLDRDYTSELTDQLLEQYNITLSDLQSFLTFTSNFKLFLDNQTPDNADYRKILNIIRTDK